MRPVEIETFRIGGIECSVVVHHGGRGTPAWMFPDVPARRRDQLMAPYLDAAGRFEFVYASMLLRTGDGRTTLLDTGSPPSSAGSVPPIGEVLASVGVHPTEIDTVVLSHGHLDHIGGLTTAGQPSFPAASHVIHERELEYWTTGREAGGEAAGRLRAIVDAGLLDTVDGEREVSPGLRLLPTPGHTPGHLAVAIASGGAHALYVGDALAHEVNVAEPGWNHFSDMVAGPAIRSRRRLVARAASDGAIIIGSHMTTRGRAVTRPDGGVRYLPVDTTHGDVRPAAAAWSGRWARPHS